MQGAASVESGPASPGIQFVIMYGGKWRVGGREPVRKCHAETPVGARSAARFRPLACGNEGDNWLHRQRVGEASLDGAELSQSRLIGLRQAAQLSSAVVSLYIVCMHVRYE